MATSLTKAEKVSLAFAVGWQMAEVFHGPIPVQRPSILQAAPDHLPGLSGLHELQITDLHIDQVTHGLDQLLDPADTEVQQALANVRTHLPAGSGQEGEILILIANLHLAILSALTVADFRLGKAYGLGRALAETDLLPRAAIITENRFNVYRAKFAGPRLKNIYTWLADLKTVLPNHASYAVSSSLAQWETWVSHATAESFGPESNLILGRQAEQWRALLSGERDAEDFLTANSYVDAAKGLSNQLGRTIGAFISRYRGTVVLVLLAIVALIGGFIAGSVLTGNTKLLWGTPAALIGLLGGWKAISGTLGKGLKAVEPRLWQSELDEAVAKGALILPNGVSPISRPPDTVGLLAADHPSSEMITSVVAAQKEQEAAKAS